MAEDRVGSFFDDYARDFDALYGTRRSVVNRVVNPLLRRSMRLRHERAMRACDPLEGKRILDVGCGPGHQMVELARGGARVVGVDLAPAMVDIARGHAEIAGVAERCELVLGDFMQQEWSEPFDHAVVLGVMDYVEDARSFVERVLSLTKRSAVLSFPREGGLLAWQRKLRYRSRCPLYLYEHAGLESLLRDLAPGGVRIEPISRDWFVRLDVSGAGAG